MDDVSQRPPPSPRPPSRGNNHIYRQEPLPNDRNKCQAGPGSFDEFTVRPPQMRTSEDVITDLLRMMSDRGCSEPNLVDVICSNNGWRPMQVGNKVVVHFEEKTYEIKRTC